MPDYRTIVQKTGAAYIPLVEKQISNGGSVDLYQHLCMENALTMMHETAVGAGLEGISALQKSEIMQILQQVATLRLNAFSRPRECYFQTRKKKQPDGNWTTSIEMGIEGDGNDVILRNFGHGVEEVYPYWDVHVDDEFTYPVHHGIDVEPPPGNAAALENMPASSILYASRTAQCAISSVSALKSVRTWSRISTTT